MSDVHNRSHTFVYCRRSAKAVLAGCIRTYARDGLSGDEVAVLLRRSLLVLAGDARYRWMHGIDRSDSAGEAVHPAAAGREQLPHRRARASRQAAAGQNRVVFQRPVRPVNGGPSFLRPTRLGLQRVFFGYWFLALLRSPHLLALKVLDEGVGDCFRQHELHHRVDRPTFQEAEEIANLGNGEIIGNHPPKTAGYHESM